MKRPQAEGLDCICAADWDRARAANVAGVVPESSRWRCAQLPPRISTPAPHRVVTQVRRTRNAPVMLIDFAVRPLKLSAGSVSISFGALPK